MKTRVWAVVLCAAALTAAALCGFLAGLKTVFLDSDRYTALMDRLDVYEDVGIPRAEQILINRDLADYLAGRRGDLNRTVTLRGEIVPSPFNEREISHMRDVKGMFRAGMIVMYAAGAAAAGLLAVCLSVCRRWERCLGVVAALAMAAILGGCVIVLMQADFSALFMAFHSLLFDNDLWLLDPATDAMIRMLPEPFFESIASDGLIAGGIGAFAAPLLSALLFLIVPERNKRHELRPTCPGKGK